MNFSARFPPGKYKFIETNLSVAMGVFWQSFYQKDLLNSNVEFSPIPPSSLSLNSLCIALVFAVFTWYWELEGIFCIADEC